MPPCLNHVPHRSEAILARAMMISCGWNKCAFEQPMHLWVSSWILPLVSRILFDPVILIVLSLDGHSCWVITRAALLYKQIDLVIRDDGVGYMIEERRIWAHYAIELQLPPLMCVVLKAIKNFSCLATLKFQKGSFFLCWLLNHDFCFALVLVEILKVVYIWKEQTLVVLYASAVA